MNFKKQIDRLKDCDNGYWMLRLHSELDFINEALAVNPEMPTCDLENVVGDLLKRKAQNGALTKADVLEAERRLSIYTPMVKQYRLHMVSHAHIDMNWMWGYDETVGIVIDTFRTMLSLLEEYPDFKFTQSQASTYEIVEKYAPDLLPDIRKRVKEGRWEVIASTWVEPDKNMISSESMVRHILYTKNYLSKLLDINPDQLQVDFEPDTFGHSANIPEILSQGGVSYYYHCRGNDQEEAYRWRAPSGKELLVLRDPQWYLLVDMDYHMAWHVPSFCAKNHTKSALRMYGVGDHGGGPTRRDIERIMDMQKWPLLPTIFFSTLHGFFKELEASREQLPVVEHELNFIFTGCYTTQSRIKQANRHGEDHLYDCEALCAMAQASGCDLHGMPGFEKPWIHTLFNQFHDILPGSCVRETREYALGLAQEANAVCISNAKRALYSIGKLIDTSAFEVQPDPESRAEGGGAGYNCSKGSLQERAFAATEFGIGGAGNGGGSIRVFTLFNPTQYDREELVEMTIWDWTEPLEATTVCTPSGETVEFDIIERGKGYWQHKFSKIALMARVPAFGYANYYVMPADRPAARVPFRNGPRIHRMNDGPMVLENEKLKATFNRETMALISLYDKTGNRELLNSQSAFFRLIDEKDTSPYSAWTIGQIGRSENLNTTCFINVVEEQKDNLREWITYELRFRSSTLRTVVSLAKDSSMLHFSIEVDWQERGIPSGATPQLQFYVPYGYAADTIRYDCPGGYIDRPELGHDVPAILYAAPIPVEPHSGIMLTSDCKYGYRAFEGAMSVTLLHGAFHPDKTPEDGIHQVELGLGVVQTTDWTKLTEAAICFAHPIYVYSNTIHKGVLPQNGQILHVDGRVRVSSFKTAEDGKGLVLRLCHSDATVVDAAITLSGLSGAHMTDILERSIQTLEPVGSTLHASIPPKSMSTIKFSKKELG